MWKQFSISVYAKGTPEDWERIENYLSLSKKYGCVDVFTSAHMPELSLQDQLKVLSRLTGLVHKNKQKLTIDFGGHSLLYILENKKECDFLRHCSVDAIRLDYGYDPKIMVKIFNKLNVSEFAWNASTMAENEILDFWKVSSKYSNFKITGCHNFYPLKYSGLDEDFVIAQNLKFHTLQIPVTLCVPCFTNPRGPLYEGLPTIESHRYFSFEKCLLESFKENMADMLLIGDEFLSKADFDQIFSIQNRNPLEIRIVELEGISNVEKSILYEKPHQIRYDSNSIIFRSQTSREMAEPGKLIEPGHIFDRYYAYITINNNNYGRYSGELQFVWSNLSADRRVNVVAKVCNKDVWKFNHARAGFSYRLVKL